MNLNENSETIKDMFEELIERLDDIALLVRLLKQKQDVEKAETGWFKALSEERYTDHGRIDD